MTPPAAGVAIQQPNDYTKDASWLCRPGRHDACDIDLTTTVVAADGTFARETWTANERAPIDCFYVYPTVSTDPDEHSDMYADPAELNVIGQQFARFASACRPYAPLYRQVTLAGLARAMSGGGRAVLDRGIGYDDVRDAWRHYLQHDNNGRGFVLIGHSQGSYVLAELIRQEIEGKPIQSRMVSAILPGATFAVPRGKDVGGAFQHVPLCRTGSQVGCVIMYTAFRSTVPPPANTIFGHVTDTGMVAPCTNPAELDGSGGQLHAYLAATGGTITVNSAPRPWAIPERPVSTPWVSVPGLLSAKCASNDHAAYLEVTVHGVASDPRVDDIAGDVAINGQIQANWGLHLIDVSLAMGNLVEVVGRQAKAYETGGSKK
ncbi:MAG: DUF3089 domain-containing protein [Acidobacteriota bacterium]